MITVEVEVQTDDPLPVNNDYIVHCCREVFKTNNHTDGKISVIITTDEEVSDLKYQFFQEKVFTDVIAFNLEEKGDPVEGEIYISWDRVCANASIFEVSTDTELKRVIIHGTLHLLGFEDSEIEEKTKMTDMENLYLKLFSESVLQV